MNCADAGRLLDDLVDGRLGEAAGKELREHATHCAACATALEQAEEYVASVSGALREPRPQQELRARVIAALARESPAPARRSPWRRPRLWLDLAASVAVAAVLLALLWPGASPAVPKGGPQRKGSVAFLQAGMVEWRAPGGGAFARPVAGQELAAESVVRTVGSEPAELRFPDGVTVVLDDGGEMVVAPDKDRGTVRLTKGQLFAEVDQGLLFKVNTSLGDVRALGTKFGVTLDEAKGEDGGLAVTVQEGNAEVARAGKAETVKAGYCWRLCPNGGSRCEGGECCRQRLQWLDRRCGGRCREGGGCGGHGYGRGPRR